MMRTVDARSQRRSFEDDAPGRTNTPPDRGGGLGAWTIFLLGVGIAAVDQIWNPWFNDVAWSGAVPGAFALLALTRKRWRSALLELGAAGALALTAAMPSEPAPVKVLVLGIDGATFDVIDPEGAALPNFLALRDEGARTTLRSMEPMFSPLLWTTIASGRLPGEHGIRGFRVHSQDCKVARFWDVAEDAGQRIGVWKWLVDYPPRVVAGFWVPSWLAPGPETWPPTLSAVKELELSQRTHRKRVESERALPELALDLARQGLRLSTLVDAAAWMAEKRVAAFLLTTADAARADVRLQVLRGKIDRDIFVAQLHRERPDIATFTFYGVDAIGHLYWDRHARGGDELRAAYRAADDILGSLRSELGPDARLVVVSDHGFQSMDGASGANGPEGRFLPKTERLRARLSHHFDDARVDVTRVGQKLTVSMDRALIHGASTWLLQLQDTGGNPVFRVDQDDDGTLALTLADEQYDSARIARDRVGSEPMSDYISLDTRYTGTHESRGILYVAGSGVTAGSTLSAASILDVAPTVLAAAGLAASQEMPGRNVVPGWTDLPRVRSWDGLVGKLRWIKAEDGVREDQLKALGYAE